MTTLPDVRIDGILRSPAPSFPRDKIFFFPACGLPAAQPLKHSEEHRHNHKPGDKRGR